MEVLRVANWEKYQHYRDRCPPWIKLHVRILNDRAFMCLPLASRGLLLLLWALASERGGEIVADEEEIRFRLRLDSFQLSDLKPLVEAGFLIDASGLLANASRCSPETETETETETTPPSLREAPPTGGRPSKPKFIPPSRQEVEAYGREARIGSMAIVDAFMDFFVSNGWKVGKNPMRDWKAAYRNWCRNESKRPGPRNLVGVAKEVMRDQLGCNAPRDQGAPPLSLRSLEAPGDAAGHPSGMVGGTGAAARGCSLRDHARLGPPVPRDPK